MADQKLNELPVVTPQTGHLFVGDDGTKTCQFRFDDLKSAIVTGLETAFDRWDVRSRLSPGIGDSSLVAFSDWLSSMIADPIARAQVMAAWSLAVSDIAGLAAALAAKQAANAVLDAIANAAPGVGLLQRATDGTITYHSVGGQRGQIPSVDDLDGLYLPANGWAASAEILAGAGIAGVVGCSSTPGIATRYAVGGNDAGALLTVQGGDERYSRWTLSSSTPQPLGTPSAGVDKLVSRADHVHAMPDFDISNQFGTVAGTICEGNDFRLSDARTPAAHTHDVADIEGMSGSSGPHTHVIADVENLQTTLDGKQPIDQTLTAIAGINSTTGLIEQTGADAFTKRPIGVGTSASLPTTGDADARYARLNGATFTGQVVMQGTGFDPSINAAAAAISNDGFVVRNGAECGGIWHQNSGTIIGAGTDAGFTSVLRIADTALTFNNHPVLTAQDTGAGLILPTIYTVSTLPPAATNSGRRAIITDGVNGKWEVRSNGEQWLYHDGVAVVGQTFIIFNGDGSAHDWIVPAGRSLITVRAWGAGGAGTKGLGGGGGFASADISVTAGETLSIRPGTGGVGNISLGGAGWPDGGYGGSRTGYMGGGGGGYSAIWRAGSCLLIAGGGGAGGAFDTSASPGGAGGGSTGENAPSGAHFSTSGRGGTQVAGGSGGTSYALGNGSAFKGGDGVGNNGTGFNGTGGGGGYFGGGSGNDHQGGGGGSAWVVPGAGNIIILTGTGQTPGNNTNSDRGTAGVGGATNFGTGAAGRIVIDWS